MSDLHLETPQSGPTYGESKIRPQCRHLALLGDIGNFSDPELFTFLEEQLQQFEVVSYRLGNQRIFWHARSHGTVTPAQL